MKAIMCPLCNSQMHFESSTYEGVNTDLVEIFSHDSKVIKIEETMSINMKCDCSAQLEFTDKNYNICIDYSDDDKEIMKNNCYSQGLIVPQIEQKDTEYFRKKYNLK